MIMIIMKKKKIQRDIIRLFNTTGNSYIYNNILQYSKGKGGQMQMVSKDKLQQIPTKLKK